MSKLQERITKEMSVSAAKSAAYNASKCLDRAILATPTGEARNALTIANIFLTHAQDVLAGRPTSKSLDDLAQEAAGGRYDAAMHRAAESRGEEARKQTPPVRAASQTYPLQGIDCPTHGPQTVLIGSHEQRGTIYADGSYDTRWHEQAGCGCHFDVYYFHANASTSVADSVTIIHNPS